MNSLVSKKNLKGIELLLLLFLVSCVPLSPPKESTVVAQEISTHRDCPIYLTPLSLDNVPVLLERFDTQLACEQKKMIMDSTSHSVLAGETKPLVVGVFSDSQSIFDISVGCYDANVPAFLKSIRFHSFAATSQAPFNVTAIRMTLEPAVNATLGTYTCAIYVCKVGSEGYCSYPKPRDWPMWAGEKMAPGYNPYGVVEFDVIVS